jgi:transcriptional regulator with XRE-family HTH domain
MKKFSPEKLVARRKALGKTQRTLSAEACLSTVSISAIENGWKEPRAGTLARLARALGCNVDYFYG